MINHEINRMSIHCINDRTARILNIERTCGWGEEVTRAPDKKGRDAEAILTSTGVIIIKSFDGMMITAWVASVPQVLAVWKRANGNTPLPAELWNRANYNNNTEWWRKACAA